MEHVLPRRLRPGAPRKGHPRHVRSRPQDLAAALLRALRKPSRRTLVVALLAAAILSGGFLWFRGSSFVAVDSVQVSGVHGVDAGAVEAALVAQAREMTTMEVNVAALEASVAHLHLVRSIAVKASFPHTLQISVGEQLPVAVLSPPSGPRTAVAADGLVLGSSLAADNLPALPVSVQLKAGEVVASHRLRSFLTVLGATPAPLLRFVERIYHGPQGLTIKMKDGLLVYFGDASRPHAKWASLAAVLSDPESTGATYVDVRLPERPAAGMPEGAEAGSTEGAQVSATDPSSAALAASLASAVNGGSSTSISPAAGSEEALTGATESPAEAPAEASSGTEAGYGVPAEGEYKSAG